MNDDVQKLADAVLHEGYLLYPYTPAALKNLHRYPFGTLYPRAFCDTQDAGDRSVAAFECVAIAPPEAKVSLEARFLQVLDAGAAVRETHLTAVQLEALEGAERHVAFEFSPVSGRLSVRAVRGDGALWKLSIELESTTVLEAPERLSRDQALFFALASAHVLVRIDGGELVSMIDPPDGARALAQSCRSRGLWPVLAGKPGSRDTLLAAPIILYDHPELAPESPGDFFDGTEIDELLTLRILTLTDEEKRAMAEGDSRGREILERTEASGLGRLSELHGRMRASSGLRAGARVRLKPHAGGDIFDLALSGKEATIQAVERDLDGRTHIAVTVDEDPGKDLGAYGHRFFFKPEEVELL